MSDVDKGACKILAHRFPHVPNVGDMTTADWSQWVGGVDVISGGTPCQDLSSAGRRRGMTDGTRSNLWVAMRDAIAIIRPALVVWENVRGAFSAAASSELEPCAGCVGDGTKQPVLRALGRVLGDLSSLGYDAFWYGLRASDIGAAHHRFRVFVFAVDSRSDTIGSRLRGLARQTRRREVGRVVAAGCSEVPELVALPTPKVTDDHHSSPADLNRNQPGLRAIGRMLPTPGANLGENGGGQHPDKRKAGGHSVSIEDAVHALPTPTTAPTTGNGHARNLGGEIRALPTPRVKNNENRQSEGYGGAGGNFHGLVTGQQGWREYETAIRRQEQAFGYPAPLPTEPNRNGKPRLSARFSEWLMGLEPGWITDVPGITRNEALKAAGNGVVPQQCYAAAMRFLHDYEEAQSA